MTVECRSDSEYAERPLALVWEGQRYEVAEILSQWRTPSGKWFCVRTVSEQIFRLHYDEHAHEWFIHSP